MNFLELCIRVHQQSGLSGSGPTSVNGQTGVLAKLVSWVVDADTDIQSLKNEWQFLWRRANAALVTDQQVYDAATLNLVNLNQLDSVYIDDELALIVDWQEWLSEFDQRLPDPGLPKVISVSPSGELHFYPVPDQDYPIKLNYYTEPTVLLNDTDVSSIPAKYHECIIQRAKMYYAEFEEDAQLYQMASARYETKLTELCSNQLPKMGFDIRGLI